MNNQPFFSIGLPVYNSSKWVGECIDSILNQNFDDFEIICVDDGSTDNSLDILNGYAKKDSRIRVISRDNDGPSTARNTLIKASNGKYIYMIDSDDVMCENVLPQVYDIIVKDNYPDVVETGYIKNHTFNGKTNILHYLPEKPYTPQEYATPALTGDEFAVSLWLDNKLSAWASTKFIRNDFITANGIMYQCKYFAREDADFSIRLFRKAKTISIAPFHSFIYFLPREGSISTVFSYKAFKSIICYYIDFFSDLEFWKLSDGIRARVAEKKLQIYADNRDYLISMPHNGKSIAEILKTAEMVEHFAGKEINKLPLPSGQNGIICRLFRLIGIKNTMSLLCRYLKLKGIVKE